MLHFLLHAEQIFQANLITKHIFSGDVPFQSQEIGGKISLAPAEGRVWR